MKIATHLSVDTCNHRPNLDAQHFFDVTAKYRHWLEWADVTLIQLWSTYPHFFAKMLHYCVTLHVYTHI